MNTIKSLTAPVAAVLGVYALLGLTLNAIHIEGSKSHAKRESHASAQRLAANCGSASDPCQRLFVTQASAR